MIRESQYILFNNVDSRNFDISSVNIGRGLLEETFVARREIIEEKIKGKTEPYFYGFDSDPIEFDLTLNFDEGFNDSKIRQVSKWLMTGYYAPLIFSEKSDRIYYCMMISDSSIFHNGSNDGYITVRFRCNSPFVYSHFNQTKKYDYSSNTLDGAKIEISNHGDTLCYPEISITKVGDGDISIHNLSNNKQFELMNLTNGEEVYVNNEREEIITSIDNAYRYDDMVGDFLCLSIGRNTIRINGDLKIQFKYQYKTYI